MLGRADAKSSRRIRRWAFYRWMRVTESRASQLRADLRAMMEQSESSEAFRRDLRAQMEEQAARLAGLQSELSTSLADGLSSDSVVLKIQKHKNDFQAILPLWRSTPIGKK